MEHARDQDLPALARTIVAPMRELELKQLAALHGQNSNLQDPLEPAG